jgi:hypothetical protein
MSSPGKTILYRLFGLGKIPKQYAAALEHEGTVLADEGCGGWVVLRSFRAPGRRHSYKQSWFTGSFVLTQKTFAVFTFSRPIVLIGTADQRFQELHCSAPDQSTLRISFDASVFHEQWSGSVECRLKTAKAEQLLSCLAELGR